MESRKKIMADHVLVIHPITLTLFQYFSLNDIYAFSLLNQSTAKMTTLFIKNKMIKNNIQLGKKSFHELQNDAKKLQTYLPYTKDPAERKTIQTLLKQVEEGKADASTYTTLITKEWKCTSHKQEAVKDFADWVWDLAKQYQHALEDDNRDITKFDLYFLATTYILSGASYLTNLGFCAFHNYFAEPIQQKFKNRLEFFSNNFGDDKKDQEDHDKTPTMGKLQ